MESFLVAADGTLERPLLATTWFVPDSIQLSRRVLRWRAKCLPHPDGKDGTHHIGPTRGMLEQFLALEGKGERHILAYAKRWGCLGLCRRRESKPLRTVWRAANRRHVLPASTDELADAEGAWYVIGDEPLHIWRYWTARFAAAMRILSDIAAARKPALSDFAALIQHAWNGTNAGLLLGPNETAKREIAKVLGDPKLARTVVLSYIAKWESISKLRLRINIGTGRIEVSTNSLFAGLVLQMMTAASSSSGFAICSECGNFYPPKRKPTENKRAYCERCASSGVPRRNATRAYRDRIRRNGTGEKYV